MSLNVNFKPTETSDVCGLPLFQWVEKTNVCKNKRKVMVEKTNICKNKIKKKEGWGGEL